MMVQHSWVPTMLGRETMIEPLSLAMPGSRQLPAPAVLPRQLDDAEIMALIRATTDDARLVVLALLSGLSTEELVGLRWDEIDPSAGMIHVTGEDGRAVPLQEPLCGLLDARRPPQPEAAETVLRDAKGDRLGIEEVGQLVQYGAHDAGLDRPQEVTPDALRYTWLSFLLRQGIRAADVSGVAGRVPHSDLVAADVAGQGRATVPFHVTPS